MKTKIKMLLILLIMFGFAFVSAKKASAQRPVLSFQVFYDQLSPYGQWIDYPNYGYVWLPDAESDFAPYSTDGHWVITEYGFTWVSDYEWGWAPFHYGRWDYDSYFGWFWIPDNEWGPAWVSWRRADGYYGWEPMGPGITLNMSFGRPYNNENSHWIFVSERYIDRSDINHYYVNRNNYDRIARNSSVINNTYADSRRNINYASGPAISDVQRATGRRVNLAVIVENNKPGQAFRNGRLSMYRPDVIKNNDNERRPAPARISERQDLKRPSERNQAIQSGNVNTQNNRRGDVPPDKVNQQNENNRTNAIQQQNSVPANRSGSRARQNAVIPQKENNNIKATQQQQDRQNAVIPQKENNNIKATQQQQDRQNTVIPQKENSNIKATQQQQQQNVIPAQNGRRVKQSADTKPPVKNKSVQKKKSRSQQDVKRKD